MTIMLRKAYESWSEMLGPFKPLPKNVAYLEKGFDGGLLSSTNANDWRYVTWEDIHEKRRNEQAVIMQRIMQPDEELKPCVVKVFFNNTDLFGGWWCYIEVLKKDWSINFRQSRKDIQLRLMELFPCGCFPLPENFTKWMENFEKEFHKVNKHRKLYATTLAWAKVSGTRLENIYLTKEEALNDKV